MGVQEREDGRKFEMASAESVKNPSHYKIKGLKEESIEVIQAIVNHNACSLWEAVLLKDCLKYLFRYGKKNGVEDLQKARVYLEWLIEEVENEKYFSLCRSLQPRQGKKRRRGPRSKKHNRL